MIAAIYLEFPADQGGRTKTSVNAEEVAAYRGAIGRDAGGREFEHVQVSLKRSEMTVECYVDYWTFKAALEDALKSLALGRVG